jgi:hypothetical protein
MAVLTKEKDEPYTVVHKLLDVTPTYPFTPDPKRPSRLVMTVRYRRLYFSLFALGLFAALVVLLLALGQAREYYFVLSLGGAAVAGASVWNYRHVRTVVIDHAPPAGDSAHHHGHHDGHDGHRDGHTEHHHSHGHQQSGAASEAGGGEGDAPPGTYQFYLGNSLVHSGEIRNVCVRVEGGGGGGFFFFFFFFFFFCFSFFLPKLPNWGLAWC